MANVEQLVMKIENLEAKIAELETKLGEVDDVKEIKKLQNIYGYYLDTRFMQEVVDLFSDDAESVEVANRGVFLGKEGATHNDGDIGRRGHTVTRPYLRFNSRRRDQL